MEKRNITKKGIRHRQKFYWADFMKEYQKEQVLIEPADDITIAVYKSENLLGFATQVGAEERKCRVCGCTWNNGCINGCWWIEEDLCSRCLEQPVGRSEIDDL